MQRRIEEIELDALQAQVRLAEELEGGTALVPSGARSHGQPRAPLPAAAADRMKSFEQAHES